MSLRSARAAWAIPVALMVGACGKGDATDPPPSGTEASELAKVGGDGQAWYYNNALPEAYRVMARDPLGRPVSGVSVAWSVVTGGGSIDPPSGETGPDGVASATHSLGAAGATQRARASAVGLTAVEFEAMATSPPQSADVSVGNNFFQPRDVTVRVGGTVTWTWASAGVAHNVLYASGPAPRPPDSPTQSDGMHSSTFAAVGRYQYFCNIHSGMDGTVTVVN